MSSSSPTSPASESTQRPVLSQLVESVFSSAEDNNVMLAAIVSLVVVILFVFVLHLYARTSFHSRRRRRRRRSSLRHPPPPSSFVLDLAALSGAASKGLDPAAIAAIPLFVSGGGAAADDAECVVCLTEFDGGEICRRLPKCGHEFHVECIDMWLGSHASCPICRAPAAMIPDGGSASDADSAETAAIADRRDPRAAADGDGAVALAIEIDGGDDDSTAGNSSAGNGCSSSSPTTSFGCSLKRMLSRNRSEHKVSPAASVVSAESTE